MGPGEWGGLAAVREVGRGEGAVGDGWTAG